MSEMVDRVADAIWRVNKEATGLRFTDLIKEMARASIEAMREPTPKMSEVGEASIYMNTGACHDHTVALDDGGVQNIWSAMIDAALKPEPSSSTQHQQPTAAQDQTAQNPVESFRR